jgi:hypothetical protein
VAALYCSCEQQRLIWGEFWWVEGKYQWVFFDDQKWSEIYTERLTHCPACGLPCINTPRRPSWGNLARTLTAPAVG